MKNLNKWTKQQLIDEINSLNKTIKDKINNIRALDDIVIKNNRKIEKLKEDYDEACNVISSLRPAVENFKISIEQLKLVINEKDGVVNKLENEIDNLKERYEALLKATSNKMVYKSSNNTSTIAMWSIILNVVLFIVALIAIII